MITEKNGWSKKYHDKIMAMSGMQLRPLQLLQ